MTRAAFSFDFNKADEIIKTKEAVYLYGMGVHLRSTYDKLKELGVPMLGIIDRDENIWGQLWEDLIVIAPNDIDDRETPIVICARGSFGEIYDELVKRGFASIFPFFFYQEKRKELSENYRALSECENNIQICLSKVDERKSIVLNSIDIVVTERCSLRCRDCSNLMQYYVSPKDEETIVQFGALDVIMEAVDYVKELRILGGEPFMNTEVYRYIERALSYDNAAMVSVYTNGTIVPQEKNLSCLEDPRVFVRISDYGKISKNLGRVQKKFEEHSIRYETTECFRWKKCDIVKLRERTDDEIGEIFDNCCAKRLYTLKNGILYGCPFAANAAALHATKRNSMDEIHTDVPIKEIKKALRYLVDCKWYDACRYCGGRPLNVTDIPAAIQTNKPLPYEKYGEYDD